MTLSVNFRQLAGASFTNPSSKPLLWRAGTLIIESQSCDSASISGLHAILLANPALEDLILNRVDIASEGDDELERLGEMLPPVEMPFMKRVAIQALYFEGDYGPLISFIESKLVLRISNARLYQFCYNTGHSTNLRPPAAERLFIDPAREVAIATDGHSAFCINCSLPQFLQPLSSTLQIRELWLSFKELRWDESWTSVVKGMRGLIDIDQASHPAS